MHVPELAAGKWGSSSWSYLFWGVRVSVCAAVAFSSWPPATWPEALVCVRVHPSALHVCRVCSPGHQQAGRYVVFHFVHLGAEARSTVVIT